MRKKIIIAYFFALLMLLVPVTANAVTVDFENKNNLKALYEDTPQLFLTKEERVGLLAYVNNNFEGEELQEANQIVNDMLIFDEEYKIYNVDVEILTDAAEEYSYYHIIPQETLDAIQSKPELNQLIAQYWEFSNYPFAGLIDKIIEIVKGRLGWLYELFESGSTLFIDGVNLAKDFIYSIQNLNIAIIFATLVNLIVTIPVFYFSEALSRLFNLNLDGFVAIVEQFIDTFTVELNDLIDIVTALLENLGQIFEPLLNYAYDVGDFVDWVMAPTPPWEQDITITGTATTLLGVPLQGAEISCKGVTTTTDSNGRYELSVSPSASDADSLPANNWYGLHKCVITIKNQNGKVLKQTPAVLSYSFSGGSISWPFIIIRVKAYNSERNGFLHELMTNFMLKFQNFFKKMNYNYQLC